MDNFSREQSMKFRLLWICMVILLVIPKPIAAQNASEGWTSGCDSQAQPIIAATTQLDYGAACRTYIECSVVEGADGICQMRALMILREGCHDAFCETEAALYAASITVFSDLYYVVMWKGGDIKTQLTTAVIEGLKSFQAKNYDKSAKAFLSVPSDVYLHAMIPLSAGLVYEAAGESDKAMADYNWAVQTSYLQPLSYYVRGKALAATQLHDDEAAIDFSLLAQYTADNQQLDSLVKPLVKAHPFPSALFEKWTAYPVATKALWGGGIYDESQAKSRTAMIAKLDGGKKLAVQNLSQMLSQLYRNLPNTLVLNQLQDLTYSFNVSYMDDYGTWGGYIKVDLSSNPIQVTEEDYQFESGLTTAFLASPANQPDPRLKFNGMICPHSALSRLQVGKEGHALEIMGMDGPAALFDAIGGKQIGTIDTFGVLEGPKCQNDHAWWKIKLDDGKTGWAIESEDTAYRLFPADDTLIPPFKNGT